MPTPEQATQANTQDHRRRPQRTEHRPHQPPSEPEMPQNIASLLGGVVFVPGQRPDRVIRGTNL